ncbi:MAG: DUF5365 family protein [Bacillus sp. (in: firmicutes)]
MYASTVEQDEEIEQLLNELRFRILPAFIDGEKMKEYEDAGVLQFQEHQKMYNGTMGEAFQLMAALQLITSLIMGANEIQVEEMSKYQRLFTRNKKILEYFGLFFPFDLHFFIYHYDGKMMVTIKDNPIHDFLV